MKENKTQGTWRNNFGFTQDSLISFTDVAKIPKSSKKQQSLVFIRHAKHNTNVHLAINPRNRNDHNMITIVQSFELLANKYLLPNTVHAMGMVFYARSKKYFLKKYSYKLDSAMISTHIDDDQDDIHRHQIVHAHLHNHIILPAFNNQGKPLYPYLRKADIYQLQSINNSIISDFGLNDYYFNQLMHLRQPISARTLRRHKKQPKERSYMEKAYLYFKEANDYAWDHTNGNYKQAKSLRDYCLLAFRYKVKERKDPKNGKIRQIFTMKGFTSSNGKQLWYNLVNMQTLRWRNKKEAKIERLLRQLNLSNMINKAVSYKDYCHTMQYVGKILPDVNNITSANKRKHNQVNLSNIYQKVRKNEPRPKIALRYGSTPPERHYTSKMTRLNTMILTNNNFMPVNKIMGTYLQDRLTHLIKNGQKQKKHAIHDKQNTRTNAHNHKYSFSHKSLKSHLHHKYRHYDNGPLME